MTHAEGNGSLHYLDSGEWPDLQCCEGNSIRIQILIAPKFVLFLVE